MGDERRSQEVLGRSLRGMLGDIREDLARYSAERREDDHRAQAELKRDTRRGPLPECKLCLMRAVHSSDVRRLASEASAKETVAAVREDAEDLIKDVAEDVSKADVGETSI